MSNFFKGFIIGIGKIIPGVSGALLAITMGVYDKSLDYILNFKKNKKESIIYLFPLVIGIVLSIVVFSNIISYLLSEFYFITMLFFIGLIIGGIPSVSCMIKRKHYFIVVISFIIFFLISISNINNIYIVKNNIFDLFIFFISGLLEAVGTVVPGISSTALLMIMGTYDIIIGAIGSLNDFSILFPFTIGFIFGLLIIVKIINFLFIKCKNGLYAFILGVLVSSIVLLVIKSFSRSIDIVGFIVGLLFMFIGIFLSNYMEEKNKKPF